MYHTMTFEQFVSEPAVMDSVSSVLDDLLAGVHDEMLSTHAKSNLWWIRNKEMSRRNFLKRFESIEGDDSKILVYRAIQFDTKMVKDYLRRERLGTYWTWDERQAFPYHSSKKSKFFYVYCGKVNADSVNWLATVVKALEYYKGEKELELADGSNIEIYAVRERREGFTGTKDYREYNIQYTAKA